MLGGIIGCVYNDARIDILSCKNQGKICCDRGQCGGVVGNSGNSVVKIYDCINFGEITANGSTGMHVGGIAGALGTDAGEGDVEIGKSINYGTIISKGQGAGGMIGKQNCGIIKECKNYGEIIVETINAGGMTGWTKKCTNITECSNYGKITAKIYNARRNCREYDGWKNKLLF